MAVVVVTNATLDDLGFFIECCVSTDRPPRDAMCLGAVVNRSVEDTGMAHWSILYLLGIAVLIHLIAMTSLADRG